MGTRWSWIWRKPEPGEAGPTRWSSETAGHQPSLPEPALGQRNRAPRDELLVDVAGKAVYAFVTGAVADRLLQRPGCPRGNGTRSWRAADGFTTSDRYLADGCTPMSSPFAPCSVPTPPPCNGAPHGGAAPHHEALPGATTGRPLGAQIGGELGGERGVDRDHRRCCVAEGRGWLDAAGAWLRLRVRVR